MPEAAYLPQVVGCFHSHRRLVCCGDLAEALGDCSEPGGPGAVRVGTQGPGSAVSFVSLVVVGVAHLERLARKEDSQRPAVTAKAHNVLRHFHVGRALKPLGEEGRRFHSLSGADVAFVMIEPSGCAVAGKERSPFWKADFTEVVENVGHFPPLDISPSAHDDRHRVFGEPREPERARSYRDATKRGEALDRFEPHFRLRLEGLPKELLWHEKRTG